MSDGAIARRSAEYLKYALTLSNIEKERLNEILDMLPTTIIDAHTHMAFRDHVDTDFPPEIEMHPADTYRIYDYELAELAKSTLWPNKIVRSLRMAHAFRGFNYRLINADLAAEVTDHGDCFGFYGLPDDNSYTIGQITTQKFAALKMYYAYRKPPYTRIDEIFPHAVLRAAAENNLPIILHLPAPLPSTESQVVEISRAHPELNVIIAHLGGHGGHYYSSEIARSLEAISKLGNVWLDTALMMDGDLLSIALQEFGSKRILFGSDEPLSLLRVVPYLHPAIGPRFYAPGYHWAREEGASSAVRQLEAELLHISQLRKLSIACESYGGTAIKDVFYSNAAKLFRVE